MTMLNQSVPDNGQTESRTGGSRRRTKTGKKVAFKRCTQQQENKQQQQPQQLLHERREHQYKELVPEDVKNGGPEARAYYDRDAIIGHELVRQYYTVLYNAPEHVWRFYAERAQYCHVDSNGMRIMVTGRPQLRGFFAKAVENGHSDGLNRRRPVVVESVNTVRCAPDQLLVMATSEQFVQSFVVEFKSPRSFAVVSSIVQQAFTTRPPTVVDLPGTRTGHVVGGGGGGGGCSLPADRQLFVGHLSGSTTAEHLRKTFSGYGEVVQVRIMDGYYRTGQPAKYKYAFIVFSEPGGVDAALAGRPIELCNGNHVNVHRSKGRRRLFPEA